MHGIIKTYHRRKWLVNTDDAKDQAAACYANTVAHTVSTKTLM